MWKILLLVLFVSSCSKDKEDKDSSSYFTNQQIADLIHNRAVFKFTTAEPTTCVAEYGFSEDNLDLAATNPEMAEGEFVLNHEVALEDLIPETTYFVRAKTTNSGGGVAYSVVSSFTTTANTSSLGRENIATISDVAISAVSSNFGGADNDSTYGINNAFDGLFSTEWATAGDGDDAFVQFSFATETELGGFGFRSRSMSDGSAIITKLRLVFDGNEYQVVDIPDAKNMREFNFDPPVNVTQVRVEAVESTGGNTGAKEIQFYPPAQ